MRRAWAAVPFWLVACTASSDVQFGSVDGDDPSGAGGTSSGGASSGLAPDGGKPPPATATDGLKNGDETDIDCGGSTGNTCADQKGCAAPADCKSGVCTSATCAAPSATDGVKNGAETDVDCGGTSGKTCAVGKACAVHADCVQDACLPGAPFGTCAAARSCRQHFGGETCGAGEPGAAGAVHEDCCVSLPVPRPAASGGPFSMDKYLITAGRMRAFLEAVDWNPKAWITANKPAWWVDAFTAMLPEDKPGVLLGTLADNASGCYAVTRGAPALWFTPAELAGTGDGPRAYTKDEMDTKVMNCFHAPLFHALCAFDGKRMPSREDWLYAWQAGNAAKKYPWGDGDFGAHAAQNFNYWWPNQPGANGDWGGYLPAPGRFPQGAGPFGHMDLGGVVENMGLKPKGAAFEGDGWFQWSFQEPTQSGHPFAQSLPGFGSGAYRPHWAVGGRCRDL